MVFGAIWWPFSLLFAPATLAGTLVKLCFALVVLGIGWVVIGSIYRTFFKPKKPD